MDNRETGAGAEDGMSRLKRRIALSRGLAKIVLLIERLMPLGLPALSVAALYVATSWFGLFRLMPPSLARGLAILLGLVFLWSLLRIVTAKWPTDAEATRRIEERSGLAHRALAALEDVPATTSGPFGEALWREHKRRMARLVGSLTAGTPTPDIAAHDRFALRAIPALLLFVAFGFSWSNNAGRLSDPFRPMPASGAIAGLRVDAWVTPPVYTRKPPVFLTVDANAGDPKPLTVPEGSRLTVRLSGDKTDVPVTFAPTGAQTPVPLVAEGNPKAEDKQPADGKTFQVALTVAGMLDVGGNRWTFAIQRDETPKIAFEGEPQRAVSGALEITYKASDDYGLTSAQALIEPAEQEPGAVALYPLPDFRLELPRTDAREAKGVTSRDLTEHPLAGKKVHLTLIATDAAGHTGRSETKDIILPARNFREPLAAAVAEERQVFALDERKLDRAIELNEALFIRPEETIPDLSQFLLIRSAGQQMRLARSEKDLKATADYLWQIALGIEGGDVANAERRVKDAQQALSDALNRNASDEEIRKLTNELRKAMNEFMQALAKQMQNNPDQNQMSADQRKMLRQQDLEKMLDEIQKLAESGSRDEARNLLNQMQRMMNNLQTARPNQGKQQGKDQMRAEIDKLGKLLQDQKKLLDDTFSKERALRDRMQYGDPNNGQDQQLFENAPNQQGENEDSDPNGQPNEQQDGMNQPMPPDPGAQKPQQGGRPEDSMTKEQLKQALKELSERQKQLEKDLKSLQEGLRKFGVKPGEGFNSAGKEMKDATGALNDGKGQSALDSQGRAIEALRKGAGELMQQLAQQGQQGSGQGGMQQQGQNREGLDPLGRQQGRTSAELDNDVKVPDEFDAERARQILETIRRKLGENAKPNDLERQYLERLLQLQ
ncbi:TIGR02302 family protein [Rhizobium sp. C4]|uniref:TIGR02302 family protein n=1 Tax=Rhizobium sp. C4 TaxID=1349800 RepID=UPI001E60F65B|nr:TIGR02302 family protein [Rhizobium sp. C4]MCD2175695.1 TIGR02302 family protein [Rhizobium sp. C4]